MTSLYGQYINERCGHGILECEHGFATFEYSTTDIVYIVDVFVVPEKRRTGLASSLVDKICEQAVKDGKRMAITTVDTRGKGHETSRKAIEKYGFRLYSENDVQNGSFLIFNKPLVETIQSDISHATISDGEVRFHG